MHPLPAPAWTDLPEAAALLADLVANPPRQRYVRGILGPNDGAVIFDDERYRRLTAIYMAEQIRVLAECDEAKDHTAFYAMVRPEDAIARVELASTLESLAMLAMAGREMTQVRRAA